MEKASEKVTLIGVERRLQSFNLPHEVFCKLLGECRCENHKVVTSSYSDRSDDRGRIRRTQEKTKRFNSSFSIRHMERIEIEKAALECPEVRSALNSKPRRLRVLG